MITYEFRITGDASSKDISRRASYIDKECIGCGREFRPKGISSVFCYGCELWVKCTECQRMFRKLERSKLKKLITNQVAFCSRSCQNIYRSASVKCKVHGHQERSFGGKCSLCLVDQSQIICKVHGTQEKSFQGICYKCHHGPMICEIHGYQKSSMGGRCSSCSKTTYKPAWSNNICNNHPKETRSAFRVNAYECWSCIKESFSIHISLELEIPDSFWQATYRVSEDSITGQFMMEEELAELGIRWFAYIKGYITSNSLWAPLVIGKTGSKLVQPSGTDIKFRYDGDKPARTFLRESGLKWDTTKVLIIPAKSETDAQKLEYELAAEHELFFS